MNRFQKGLLDIGLRQDDVENSERHGEQLVSFLARYGVQVAVASEYPSEVFVLQQKE